MNRPARFTVADLRRAIKAAEAAGRDVEIAPDGTIRIVQKVDGGRALRAPLEPVEEVVF